jgi:tRNA(Ile)-lysidine synthase
VRGLSAAALDRRLDPSLSQPVAVAVSGGGDSLAALVLTKAWADAHGRRVVVLHVDHGLQAASADWRDFTAAAAARLGAGFRALAWTGEKPARGLAAAARDARHALIAGAARDAGAAVVVFGHTADDLAEAALMRAEGSSLGAPREWSPSPAWPEGRGVFLLRPLLSARRAAIREALAAAGWAWIDDPANADPHSARARARQQIDAAGAVPCVAADDGAAAALAGAAGLDEAGVIRLDRASFRAAPAAAGRRVLAAAMLSAGGGSRPPRRARTAALAARLAEPDAFTATLAGAKLIATQAVAVVVRDAGETARGGQARQALGDEPLVWDGRFELTARRAGLVVRPLKGAQRRLDPAAGSLAAIAAPARGAAPAIEDAAGALTCPILAGDCPVVAKCLVGARFLAACGAVWKEPAA